MNLDLKSVLKITGIGFIIIALIIGAIVLNHYIGDKFFPKPAERVIALNTDGKPATAGEPQIVYIQGQNTVTKEIAYVPKEIDPKTGQIENTQVQFERKAGKVYVKINGKDFEVPAEVKEDAAFKNGKLLVTEESTVKLNITAPKPAFNLGLGWTSKNDPALQVNGPLYKNVSFWVYGDKERAAGGLQFPVNK